jgi:hypothetical protein
MKIPLPNRFNLSSSQEQSLAQRIADATSKGVLERRKEILHKDIYSTQVVFFENQFLTITNRISALQGSFSIGFLREIRLANCGFAFAITLGLFLGWVGDSPSNKQASEQLTLTDIELLEGLMDSDDGLASVEETFNPTPFIDVKWEDQALENLADDELSELL